jgi:signal transduction histidine kinase
MPTPLKPLSYLLGSRYAFPLAALAGLVMLVISEASYRQAVATLDMLGSQGVARTNIQTLVRGLTDAETGQRGYLLTHRKDYLQPYLAAQGRVVQSLDWLTRYYGAEPGTAALMQKAANASRNKLSELDETIKLFDTGKESAWRELVMTDIGREEMDLVRQLSEQLLARETAKVNAGRESVYQTLLLSRIGVSTMTVLSLLALFMYLRQTPARARQRVEQAQLVQAERDQLEIEARRRTEQLTELAHHLQNVREDERHRLARELHDELGALLTAAKLDVARLKSRLAGTTPEVAERLTHLTEGLNSGIALKRRIIEDLRPSSLGNLGLVAALDILVREWGQRTEVAVDTTLATVRLRPSGELTVYRLVQEALTNISKYARASRVQVSLSSAGGRVRVTVRDNGVGFDTDTPKHSTHGLLGMRYRIESEGGKMQLKSSPGHGTEIDAEIPEGDTEIEAEVERVA